MASHRMHARWRLGLVLLTGLMAVAALAPACDKKPSDKDCTALLDRIVDMEVAAAGTKGISPEMRADLDKQRESVRDYLRDSFMNECKNKLPVDVVKCQLQAKTKAELAACHKK